MKNAENKKDFFHFKRQYAIVGVLFFSVITSLFIQPVSGTSSFPGNSRYSEELYVRTDRDIYIAGEKIFLKVYCLSRLTHCKSGISSVAYANLLDRLNNPVVQVKIHINGLSGSGYFVLPDSLSTGNYYIATCTRWMQNFSPELFSYKCISVINPFRNIDRIKIPAHDPVADTVIFYPESGNIIPGYENVIGFKCFGNNKEPAEIKGVITDNNEHIFCDVHSDENGFGRFSLNPSAGTRIYLRQTDGDRTSVRFELPAAVDSGIALSVTEEREKGIFRIKVLKGNSLNRTGRKYNLICEPVSMDPFFIETDLFKKGEIIISRNSIPAGLVSVNVADDKGKRYAKRWIYNHKNEALNFTVRTDKQYYSTREKVKIDITAAGLRGEPVECDLLVSAAGLFTLSGNIVNTELDPQIAGLSAEGNKSMSYGINNKLIFLKDEYDPKEFYSETGNLVNLPEPDCHLISGIIKNSISGEPLAEENIVLSFVGKKALCRFTTTDEKGRFIFMSSEEGIREIVIQPLSPYPEHFFVELDNPFPEVFSRSYADVFTLDTGMLDMINNSVISMQVRRIYDSFGPEESETIEKTDEKDFFGQPEYTTQMSNYIQLTSLREAIKEIVPGAVTSSSKGKTVINTLFKHNLQAETRNPLVMVDGVPVFDHEKVLNIRGEKIEKIDVLNNEYIISGIALGGIINITTFTGDLSAIEFDNPVFRQEFEALQRRSDLNYTDYSGVSQKESRIPDFRNTLYWNPEVRTNENGQVSVEFYTSDEPGDYTLLVEGFTSDGDRGIAAINFSVRSDKGTKGGRNNP